MKTIADFKKRLTVGTKLKSKRFVMNNGVWVEDLAMNLTREVSKVMSTQFALSTLVKGKLVDSFCDYPKKAECLFLDDNTLEINHEWVKLVYIFEE